MCKAFTCVLLKMKVKHLEVFIRKSLVKQYVLLRKQIKKMLKLYFENTIFFKF